MWLLQLCDHVPPDQYYTNAIALPGLALLAYSNGEFVHFRTAAAAASGMDWAVILAGCVVGTLIGGCVTRPVFLWNA